MLLAAQLLNKYIFWVLETAGDGFQPPEADIASAPPGFLQRNCMSVLVRRPVRLCRLPPSALLLCTGINAIYWLVVFVFFTTGIFISLSSPSVVLLPSLSVLLTGISTEL